MASQHESVYAEGERYRLGRTAEHGAIWRKRPWGWRIVARYPLNDEGWQVASAQFAMWEPGADRPSTSTFAVEAQHPPELHGATPPPTPQRRRGFPAWLWAVVTVVVLGAAVGGLFAGHVIGGTPTSSRSQAKATTSSPPAVGSGYLATGKTWILYVQWSDHHGALSGSLQEVTATGSPPTAGVSSTTATITGTVTRDKVSLSFNGGPDRFGVLTQRGFTINVRLKSGLLVPVHFREASTRQYNLAVAHLHTQVAHANTVAAVAQQRAALRTTINKAATLVASDIAALGRAESRITTDVAAVASALETEGTQLAKTRQAEQAVLAMSPHATTTTTFTTFTTSVCTAADSVATDSDDVATAADSVATAVGTVTSDLSGGFGTTGLQQLMSSLSSAWADYQTAQAKLSTYVPPSPPTATAIQSALASATSAGTSAAATTNGYVAQANTQAKSAVQFADAASNFGGCGWSQATPAPVSTLSWTSG